MSEIVKEIELGKIRPNRLNPRLDVNIEHLNELADSIREVGLLEPIIVRPVNSEFEVVVGERRYRASQQARTIIGNIALLMTFSMGKSLSMQSSTFLGYQWS